jgi:hypothetical protein
LIRQFEEELAFCSERKFEIEMPQEANLVREPMNLSAIEDDYSVDEMDDFEIYKWKKEKDQRDKLMNYLNS